MVLLVSLSCAKSSTKFEEPDICTLVVRNKLSSIEVISIWISPCGGKSWVDNRLNENETVSPGEEKSFELTPVYYDLRARFDDGQEVEKFDVNIKKGGTFARSFVPGESS